MSEILVSIIIPTFNRASEISMALNSVIEQNYNNWECIVVDDGSTDNSLSVLQKYRSNDNRIQFYKRNRLPKGAPTCRNIGLKKARGTYVIFLDSDDYLENFCLKQRVKVIEEKPNLDFLVFPMSVKKNNKINKAKIPSHKNYLLPFLSANLPWSIMCPIWKREFLVGLNGFTEGYPRFNDPELMIRALLKTNDYGILDFKPADSVHIPSTKTNIFADKVSKSLKLLIPDVIDHLKENNKLDLRKHLVGYLYLWFKYIYKPSKDYKLGPSLEIISIFKRYRILSFYKSLNLVIRLFLFSWSSKFFKSPIDKLTHKSLYQ